MADAEKTLIEKLKLVEREMDTYEWYRAVGLGDAIREAIERLTPRPMTLQEIAEIMNREQYRGATDWRVKASGGIGCIGEHLSSRTAVGLQGLPPFESTAVVEKLEREKEAARA